MSSFSISRFKMIANLPDMSLHRFYQSILGSTRIQQRGNECLALTFGQPDNLIILNDPFGFLNNVTDHKIGQRPPL